LPNIKILPETLTNKIAAGEVVQRPSSVVKELIENSIDAGATEINVIIKNGGRSLIQVVDNGSGMDKDDLLLAFERYATSKIYTEKDLYNIKTLGFRGEALASIASVSMVEAISGIKGEEEAHRLEVVGGTFKKIEPCPNIGGTSISVKNLFFNVPARRKFLKSAEVEFRHIIDIFRKFTLSFPELMFTLVHNEREIYILHAENLLDRIGNLFSKDYVDNLIEVNDGNEVFSITGYIGNLNLLRNRRGEQFWFVNGRYIVNRTLNNAVLGAYSPLISGEEYPFYCLKLSIEPFQVDVNVHPSKMEIKFKDEYNIYNQIKNILAKYVNKLREKLPGFDYIPITDFYKKEKEMGKILTNGIKKESDRQGSFLEAIRKSTPDWKERARKFSEVIRREEEQPGEVGIPVFQFAKRYIITQTKSGIIIIDQHVAHERILYEEAYNSIKEKNWKSQQLLFPQVVELTYEDYSILLEILPYLEKIGFKLRDFGKNAVIVEAVPAGMRWGIESTIIKEIIDGYLENKKDEPSATKNVIASYSCKAAIKSGDKLTEEEMITLVNKLFMTNNPYFCPHGRPIIVNLTIDEIDKRFGRK